MQDGTEIKTKEELLKSAKKYISKKQELKTIERAYDYAFLKHRDDKRLSGDPTIIHLLNVSYILTKIRADYISLSVALLHEIDTDEEELKELFGLEIAHLVNGVKKINRLSLSADSEYLINYYKKILVGLCEDVRVIIIKLADRLHNMRTLWALPEDKQKEKAKETLEILAPIAHHLGIHYIKSELEDLCLRYYKSDVYYDIVKNLNNTKVERDVAILEMKESISNILNEHGIKHEIKGRSKSIYSIYTKLCKGKKFNEIYDILALRVYVDTETDCYLALGLIHSKYKPLSNRFKDYIAMPKENMYQSLHTTIFGIDGKLFEVQIRTQDMDRIAEYGIASHWAYKEKKDATKLIKSTMEQKLQIFRNIIENNSDNESDADFASTVEREVLNDEIYVYTPKGDVIQLPIGSTPIDFAYKVHTNVGDKMIGAIVNDNIVSLDYELKDGDIVKININKNSKGPSKEWINIVKTSQARSRIKSFYTKIDKEENIKRGKDLIEKELRRQKIVFNDFYTNENIDMILKSLNESNMDDVYLCCGNNKYAPSYIINLIYKQTKTKEEIILDKLTTSKKECVNKNDIVVCGIDEIKVSLASCCKPVKGDEVIGYITKGKGITVHRSNCHNVSNTEDRIVSIEWNLKSKNKFPTNLLIKTEKKENFLLQLVAKASSSNITINTINTINNLDYYTYDTIVMTEDLEKLNKFINDVYQMKEVIQVERIMK
jgi:GTP pyrophosphokinase